jgi:hypothetical protein
MTSNNQSVLRYLVYVTWLATVIAAAPFNIPSGWKVTIVSLFRENTNRGVLSNWHPYFDASLDERISVSQRELDLIARNMSTSLGYGVSGLDCWQAAHVLSGVGMAEYTTGTKRLQDNVTNILELVAAGLGHKDS